MKFYIFTLLAMSASAITLSKSQYNGELPHIWNKDEKGDPYMTQIVRKYGNKEADGQITISKENAHKIMEEAWEKNPQNWPKWKKENKEEAFYESWAGADPNKEGKVAADVIPVVIRQS